MTFVLILAALYGGLAVPFVLLAVLALERRNASKRIASLKDGRLRVEQLRAIHLIENRQPKVHRNLNRRDLRTAPAILALWVPVALSVASPFASGASETALLLCAICGVWWWQKLESSGVANAWYFPIAAWMASSTIWLATMSASSIAEFPLRAAPEAVDPLNLQLWDGVFHEPIVPIFASVWGCIILALATVAVVKTRATWFPSLLLLAGAAPLATVVWTGSLLSAHQIALAVGLVGYAMSKAKRRQRDYATELNMIGSVTGEGNSDIAPRAKLPRVVVNAVIVATTATLAVAAINIGSWTIASTNALRLFSDDNPWPWFIYIQVWLAACPGIALLAWSVVNRNLDRYGAMGLGFMWPLVLAFLLDMHTDRGPGWLWEYQDWLLVPVFAAGMVVAMWVVTYGIRAKLPEYPKPQTTL